jgi:ubiquinone/menaquinone biosynthesis C-methylase UbiE
MPILVDDFERHSEMIDAAIQQKPTWFTGEQLPEELNPWRFILEKRRKYVQSVLIQELQRLGLTKFNSLLDLGCGDGNNLRWIKDYTENLYASDYNMTRLLRAHSSVSDAIIFLADICNYPVRNNSFSCIYFNHVLEHIASDVMALKEVHRILRPGGLLILGVPNEGAFCWQLAYKRSPESLEDSDHCWFYTAKTIKAKIQTVGLTCISIKHMGWGPPSWKWEAKINQRRITHEMINLIGKIFFPKQSSALYLIARKSD